jgi:hypothetical protein
VIVVSGLVAPMWAVVLMLLGWGVLAGQLIAISRRDLSPWWYLAVPLGAGLMWLVVVAGLGALLGWTA